MVLLGGINTGIADADAAADFVKGDSTGGSDSGKRGKKLEVVINLIPWNPVQGVAFEGRQLLPPSNREIAVFTAALEQHGLNVTRRFKKGAGISGACGQLGVV